ncbi:MAG: RnfABCDGE type electron transport complex subunit B, partial [Clostridiales bacterium]|nr:RnfABCDGE type electron transport complex subunit B [Clostridiales bacterium]
MELLKIILLSLALSVGISAVLGLLLAFCGKKFAVETDERIERVEKLLAGVNCGGCGYPGCAGFADALCKGDATVDKCNPTKAENKEKIK